MTVTTNSDLSNGDTSSWISLQASPGPDGVSLREALEVTNSAPGDYTIRFAQQLAGAAVQVGAGDDLPALTGGSVFINGDIDGDGKPDVTLSNVRPHEPNAFAFGLKISSSGNRLHALVLENFSIGVFFRPLSGDGRYADNEVSRVVFRGMHVAGIVQNSGVGAPGTELTNNHWLRTRLIGNTIESKGDGIALFLYEAIGDVVEQLVVSDNAIRITESGGRGISIAVGGLAGSRDNRLSDAVISGNSIEGAAFAAIGVSSGELGASNNTVERLRVAGNRIRIDSPTTPEGFSRMAIGVAAGDGATDHNNPGTSPILYPENNVMRDVEIAGNTLTGRGGLSIAVSGGCCGAAGNFVTAVRIAGNTVRGTSPGAPTVSLVGAASGGYYSRSSTENDISDVSVEGNSITLVPEEPAAEFAAGLFWTGGVLVGGGQAANTGRVQDVRVRSNCIDTEYIGISVVGGFGDPGFPAAGNTVSHVEVRGNVVSRPPVQLNQFRPEVRGIHLTGGIDATTGNSVSCVVVADNHVAGVLDALSTLDDIGAGASGNVATTVGC